MESSSLVLTRVESQQLDSKAINEFGIPSIILMENAGCGVANFLRSKYLSGTVFIFCGKGNNAGDGLVAARHLDNHNIPVKILLFSSPDEFTKDAKINYQIAIKSEIPIYHSYLEASADENIKNQITSNDWIIDALFGTGLIGIVKPPFDKVIQAINSTSAKILSVDIPSGLDCDKGTSLGIAVKAHYTITFLAIKKGFTYPKARMFLGEVHLIDIGIPKIALEKQKLNLKRGE